MYISRSCYPLAGCAWCVSENQSHVACHYQEECVGSQGVHYFNVPQCNCLIVEAVADIPAWETYGDILKWRLIEKHSFFQINNVAYGYFCSSAVWHYLDSSGGYNPCGGEEGGANVPLIAGATVGAVLGLVVIIGAFVAWWKWHTKGGKPIRVHRVADIPANNPDCFREAEIPAYNPASLAEVEPSGPEAPPSYQQAMEVGVGKESSTHYYPM